MPHVIDRETGLCSICKKSEIAAIKEGRKFKRHSYDVRKAAVQAMTTKHDPNYHAITDRHYVTYDEPTPRKSVASHRQSIASYKSYSKSPFTSQSTDQFDSEDEEVRRIEANSRKGKMSLVPRENLRKANIAYASRLGILPLEFQTSEPNIVYTTPRSNKTPKYVVVNDDLYDGDGGVYFDYGNQYDVGSVVQTPRKKKVVVHHHYEDPSQFYAALEDNSPPVVYQTGSTNDLVYYKYV